MSYYAPKGWILLAAIFANFPRKRGDINDCIDTSFVGCLHNFPNINNEAKYRTHTGIFFQEINRTPFFLFSTAGALAVITVKGVSIHLSPTPLTQSSANQSILKAF